MKTIILALLAFFLLLDSGDAQTTDGTQLSDGRRPDRPFPKAFAEATKALGNDATKFACTSVRANTPASGGGWRFAFDSAERKAVTIYVHRNGTNTQYPSASNENAFPPAPRFSILDAIAAADAVVQRRLNGFFFTGADWNAKNGSWHVFFNNPAASEAFVTVDPAGSGKLERVTPRRR